MDEGEIQSSSTASARVVRRAEFVDCWLCCGCISTAAALDHRIWFHLIQTIISHTRLQPGWIHLGAWCVAAAAATTSSSLIWLAPTSACSSSSSTWSFHLFLTAARPLYPSLSCQPALLKLSWLPQPCQLQAGSLTRRPVRPCSRHSICGT